MDREELMRLRGVFQQTQGTPLFQVGMRLLKEIDKLQRQSAYTDSLAARVSTLEDFLHSIKDDLPAEKQFKAYEIL